MTLWRTLSDLGDTVNALASAGVIAIWCWRMVNRLSAGAFVAGLAALMAAVVGLKLISATYAAAPDQTAPFALSTGAPSGHAALASFIYGSAALLCLRAGRGALAAVSPLLLVAVIATVAATRVTLGFHTVADVVAGVLVSAVPLLLVDRALRAQAVRPSVPTAALLTGLLVVASVTAVCGVRLPSTVLL